MALLWWEYRSGSGIGSGALLNRTQEVAGSSPASSIPTEIRSMSGFLASGGLVGAPVRGPFAERYPQYRPQNLGQDGRD